MFTRTRDERKRMLRNIFSTYYPDYNNFIKYDKLDMYITGGWLRELILAEPSDIENPTLPSNEEFKNTDVDVILNEASYQDFLYLLAKAKFLFDDVKASFIENKCTTIKISHKNYPILNISYYGNYKAQDTVDNFFDFRFNTLLFNLKLILPDITINKYYDDVIDDLANKDIVILQNPVWDIERIMRRLKRFINRGFKISKQNYQFLCDEIYLKIDAMQKDSYNYRYK